MTKFVLDRVENIVGKHENIGYQHFSPFPTMFSKAISFEVVKSRDCVVKSLCIMANIQEQFVPSEYVTLLIYGQTTHPV